MGLKISTFQKNGMTFTDAYAKVTDIRYNNDSKIASFGIKVFTNKTDKNAITDLQGQWAKISPSVDMVAQCYSKISFIIEQTKARIAKAEADNALITDNDNLKLRNESKINQLKNNELLQLNGATEW